MTVRLLCLRHAESENGVGGVAGALPMAELTGRGRAQAEESGLRLRGEGVGRVYASTAVRARQTAEIVARTLGLDDRVVLLPGMVEVGLGKAEGARSAAVRRRTAEVLRSWIVDGELGEAVADGEDGHAVTARVSAALTSIARGHPGETVAVVGHVASLTTGLHALCGLGGRVWGAPLPYATPFTVEWDGRAWRCDGWPAECPA
ncbi:histidine phosphatase family protein [Nonomuraea sp. NPDC050404]|uniref:histidine phosphatase family protein n=1 Tax=Nonomuraea sp. NPDC050404 TaxID=3155783 RepID=UPI003410C5C9